MLVVKQYCNSSKEQGLRELKSINQSALVAELVQVQTVSR